MTEYIKSIEHTSEGVVLVSNKNVYITATGRGNLHIMLNKTPVDKGSVFGRKLIKNRHEANYSHKAKNGEFVLEYFTGYQFILDCDDILEIGLKKDP